MQDLPEKWTVFGVPLELPDLSDPQAAQSMTIELSDDPETRAKQLELLKEYGYDVSQFM